MPTNAELLDLVVTMERIIGSSSSSSPKPLPTIDESGSTKTVSAADLRLLHVSAQATAYQALVNRVNEVLCQAAKDAKTGEGDGWLSVMHGEIRYQCPTPTPRSIADRVVQHFRECGYSVDAKDTYAAKDGTDDSYTLVFDLKQ